MDFVLSTLPELMVVRWYWKSRSLHQRNEQKEKKNVSFWRMLTLRKSTRKTVKPMQIQATRITKAVRILCLETQHC